MTGISLVNVRVKYLEDTKEWYAWTDEVNGAHAVADTPQDAIANLGDLLPDLISLASSSKEVSTMNSFSVALPVQ